MSFLVSTLAILLLVKFSPVSCSRTGFVKGSFLMREIFFLRLLKAWLAQGCFSMHTDFSVPCAALINSAPFLLTL